MGDKTFCKSTDGNFGESIVCSEGKSVSKVTINSSKNSVAPSTMEAVQCNQPATRWLADQPVEWCRIRHSVLVSDRLGTQNVYGQIGLGDWKSMWLRPWRTSIPAMATVFMSPCDDRGSRGNRLTWLFSCVYLLLLKLLHNPFHLFLNPSFSFLCFYFVFFPGPFYQLPPKSW